MSWDPGFGIRDPESGKNLSRVQESKSTGSRVRIRNTVLYLCTVFTGTVLTNGNRKRVPYRKLIFDTRVSSIRYYAFSAFLYDPLFSRKNSIF
jgi:hypothetical protein